MPPKSATTTITTNPGSPISSNHKSASPTTTSTITSFDRQLHLANRLQAEELYGMNSRQQQLLVVLISSVVCYFYFDSTIWSWILFAFFSVGSLYTFTDGFSSGFISQMIARGKLIRGGSGDNNKNNNGSPMQLYVPKGGNANNNNNTGGAGGRGGAKNNANNNQQQEALMRPIHAVYGQNTQYQNGPCNIIRNNNNQNQNNNNQNNNNNNDGTDNNNNNQNNNNNTNFNQTNSILQKTGLFASGQPLWFRGGQQVDRFNELPEMLNQVDSQGILLNTDYNYLNNNSVLGNGANNNNNNNKNNNNGLGVIQNFFGGGSFRDGKNFGFVNGLQVSFSLFNKQASSTTQTDVAATFAALGVRDPNVATARVINWVLSILKKVAAEIVKSDKEVNGLLAGVGSDFRCALSLEEESPVNSLAPPNTNNNNNNNSSGGWGSGNKNNNTSSGSGGWGSSSGSGGWGNTNNSSSTNTTGNNNTTSGGWGNNNTSSGSGTTSGGWGNTNSSSNNNNKNNTTTGGWGNSSSSGGGWGNSNNNNNSNNSNSNNKPRKLDVLLQEQKRLETSGGSDPRTIQDTVKRVSTIDLRLQLDALLDIEGTFPPTIPSKSADKSRRQTYVAQRIATLAASSNLAAFNFFGGDADRWSAALPSDPLIVMHILRHRAFRGMVRLAHEPAKERELSLCVGHTGVAPCFFVRYANPPEVPYKEFHPAANSREGLFHAVLMLVAIIANKHRGSYGTLATGVVDLQQLKITNIVV